MRPTDRAIEEIRKRRSVRTPILGALLGMEDADVDALLAEPLKRGALIGCDVQVGGVTVKEYRASLNGGGALDTTPYFVKSNGRKADPVKARLAEWRQPNLPPPRPRQALRYLRHRVLLRLGRWIHRRRKSWPTKNRSPSESSMRCRSTGS